MCAVLGTLLHERYRGSGKRFKDGQPNWSLVR
uniref:Uncharacterized protein n=1 Tax=Anguilla anguilla TaxID=7936 RepID=A0A0E9W0P0_ANGAN